jgi:formate--tetrahydrofolate ligase
MEDINLHFTGDFHAIGVANNLLAAALDNHINHGNTLRIDPTRVVWKRVVDMNDRALRQIVIGVGGTANGQPRESGYDITVASEVMAIFCLSESLTELKQRLGKIIVAYTRDKKPVTAADLKVHGAMAALLKDAIKPNLVQTLENNPAFVHGGPFANIAHGCNSLIATKLSMRLADYTVTEAGFGADLGAEKFIDIKCRQAGLKPDAVVLVATVRALKMHGGGPAVQAGRALDPVYTGENLGLLEKGCENLLAHIGIVQRSGIRPVVCLNSFHTDTPAEHALVRRVAEAAGARFAVSSHWLKGGAGAVELAEAVIEACEEPSRFAFLSDLSAPLSTRVEAIVKEVYGGDGVTYSNEAKAKLAAFEADPAVAGLPVCMAKTQYSLSHDPKLIGRPQGWSLPVRDFLLFQGAGLVVPVAGDIKLMPGTASNAAFRGIDVDTATGKVKGLF